MANFCSCYLTLEGKEENIQQVIDVFKKMQITTDEEIGAYFDENQPKDGWFFNIYTDDGYINYETKWGPNIQDVVELADKYKVDFELEYSEDNMLIYGKYIYNYATKKLVDVELTNEEIDQFEYDEGKEHYVFRDELYECNQEIIEILIKEKQEKLWQEN